MIQAKYLCMKVKCIFVSKNGFFCYIGWRNLLIINT